MDRLPSKKELMETTLAVLKDMGGQCTTAAINDAVIKELGIPQELLEIEDANCTGTEYSYRMRWARTELKQKGFISNPSRGLWKLTGKED